MEINQATPGAAEIMARAKASPLQKNATPFDNFPAQDKASQPGEMSNNNFAFGDRGEIFINTCDKFLALRPPDLSNS